MLRGSLLARTYPVVIPSSAPGRDGTDGADGASVTGPQGPAGADGQDGTNGTTVLLNTVDAPVTMTDAGDHLFATYTLPANELKAGDIIELEILASLPAALTSTLNFTFHLGNTNLLSQLFQLVQSSTGVSDGMPAIPPEGDASVKVLFKARMLVKSLTSQFCIREYSFISASAEPVFRLGSLPTSVNLANSNTFEGRLIITGTGTVVCHYVTLVKLTI